MLEAQQAEAKGSSCSYCRVLQRPVLALLAFAALVRPSSAFHSSTVLHCPSSRVRLSMSAATKEGTAAPSTDDMLNPLLKCVATSKTIEIHSLTKAMEARGETVVSLCVGEPDFPPPQQVIDATVEAVTKGFTRYTAVTGEATLRKAICADLQRRKGVTYAPEEIIVGNGAKQGVYQAILALCRPGDEVVIPAPYWPSYPEIVKLAGATPVILETSAESGFLIDPQALSDAINAKTRMLILCNPSNPTGAVQPPELLDRLGEVLRRPHAKHTWVLSDEIYERILYDTPHKCMSVVEGLRDRVLLVNGFSKAFAMTGYRLGYLAAPLPIIKACTTLQSQITSCASSIAQHAGVVALNLADDVMDPSVAIMRRKRDQVMAALSRIPAVTCQVPQGAFYVLPDICAYFNKTTPQGDVLKDSHDICLYLLKQYKVALVSGDAFGAPNTLRISYATSEQELATAMERLTQCLASLS